MAVKKSARQTRSTSLVSGTAPVQKCPKPPFPTQRQTSPGIESKLRPRPQYLAPTYRAADKLRGKVALITGGDSGIGRAVAVLYAREGANVAIVYLPKEESDARETCRAVEAEGTSCLMLPGDLTSPGFCDQVIGKTVKAFRKLDILVSNAAHQNRKKTLGDVTDAEFDTTFKTNIYAYFRLCRAALKHMKRGAAIIATSSETGILGSPQLPDYSETKGAINAFTKTLARNLIAKGIRVNAVAPGPVWTPLNPSDSGMKPSDVAHSDPTIRWGARRSPKSSLPPMSSLPRTQIRRISPAP